MEGWALSDVYLRPAELKSILDDGREPVLIIDVRTAEEYAEARMPGARHIPSDELEARLGEVDLDALVVCY